MTVNADIINEYLTTAEYLLRTRPRLQMEYTSQARKREQRAQIEPLDYVPCCDDPQPRIGEQSGRIFCATCRRYLDNAPPLEEADDGDPTDDQ
jgi:hypothetical protein